MKDTTGGTVVCQAADKQFGSKSRAQAAAPKAAENATKAKATKAREEVKWLLKVELASQLAS